MRKTLTLSALATAMMFASKGSTQTPAGAYAVPLPAQAVPQAYPSGLGWYSPGTDRVPLTVQAVPQAYLPPPATLPMPVQPPRPPEVASWTAPRAEPARLVTKVFDITEIVMLVGTKGTPAAVADRAERLTSLIEGFVEPNSWKCAGGRGSMVFFAENYSLVVNNESRVVAGVETWLDKLRGPAKPEVRVSTVHVRCEAGALCKLGFGDRKPNESLVLNADQLALVKKGMEARAHFEIITAPSFHLVDGQAGFFQVGGNDFGISSRVTPTVAPDRRTILVQMETQTSETSGTKIVLNATSGDTATAINRTSVQGAYAIPNGGTMLVSLGERTVAARIQTKVPVIADLPMFDKFFSHTRTEPRQYETFMLVTANTKEAGSVERPPLAMPVAKPQPPVMLTAMPQPVVMATGTHPVTDFTHLRQMVVPPPVDFVAAYRKACAEGRMVDARNFALQALAIDPKCFETK